MTTNVKYWLRFALTIIGSGAAGYGAGDIVSAIVSACSAGVGLLQASPTDPRQAAKK